MKKLLKIIQDSIQWVKEHSIFQKFVLVGLLVVSCPLKGQYMKAPTR